MGYKLITFDFTGTLMRFRKPPTVQYENIARLYGIEIKNKKAFHDNFKKAFKTVNEVHPNFGASTNLHWTQWWLNVVKRTFTSAGVDDGPNLDATSWHLIKLYGTTAGWEVVPGVERVLQSLKQRDKRIAIISNMDPRIENILQEAGLRHYFEFVLPSYEVKCVKPQSDIFRLALERYSKENTKPEECCHIGDSYNEDYLGAVQSGWNAILVNPCLLVNKFSNSLNSSNWCANFEEFHDRLLDSLINKK